MGEREGDITTESLGASSCSAHGASPVPGLIAIFSNQQPMSRIWRVADAPLELGRANLAEGAATDGQISRQHARIVFDGTAFLVTDLGSRNGTFLRGARISGETRAPVGSTIRIGGTVLLTTADIQPFKDHGLGVRGGSVGGPALRRALA